MSVYTYAGKQVYSLTGGDPVDLPSSGYSALKVHPTVDGTNLAEITATYVYGNQDGEYVTCVFGDIALESLHTRLIGCGCHTLAVVEEFARNFSSQEADRILTVAPVPGHDQHQRLVDAFAIGVASCLGYLCLLTNAEVWSQNTTPLPFYFDLPFTDSSLGVASLNRDVFGYLETIGQIVIAINEGSVGQQWLEQILNFWNIWGDLFSTECQETTVRLQTQASQAAMKGLAGYIGSMTSALACKYSHLNEELEAASDRIKALRDEALVSCRLHKQNHLGDLCKEKETILDEVDDKLLEWDRGVKCAMDRLAEANETVITAELGRHRDQTLGELEETKHVIVEEIVRVKDECLRTLINQDTFNERLVQALQDDPNVRRLVTAIVRDEFTHQNDGQQGRLRQEIENQTSLARQESQQLGSRIGLVLDQIEQRQQKVDLTQDRNNRILQDLATRIEELDRKLNGTNPAGQPDPMMTSMLTGVRIEIEQLKAEVVELRQSFAKVLRCRMTRF